MVSAASGDMNQRSSDSEVTSPSVPLPISPRRQVRRSQVPRSPTPSSQRSRVQEKRELEKEMQEAARNGCTYAVLVLWEKIDAKGIKSPTAEEIWGLLNSSDDFYPSEFEFGLQDRLAAIALRKTAKNTDQKRRAIASRNARNSRYEIHGVKLYGALLNVLAREGRTAQTKTYNMYLNACIKTGEFTEAIQFLERMRRKGIEMDDRTFGTVINGYAERIRPSTANKTLAKCRELIEIAKADKIKRTVDTYNPFVKACVNCGRMNLAYDVLDEMIKAGIRLNVMPFLSILTGYARLVRSGTAKEIHSKCLMLLERMKELEVQPDATVYNVFMNVCAKGGLQEEAKQTIEVMKENGCSPTVVSYNTLVDMYALTITPKTAMDVLKTCRVLVNNMELEGLAPNARTYTALLKVCANGELIDQAEEIFNEMRQSNIRPIVVTFNVLIDAYSRSVTKKTAKDTYRRCRDLIHIMETEGVEMNARTYSVLLNVCAKSGLAKEANRLFDEMVENEIYPTIINYTTLIDTYSRIIRSQIGNLTYRKCQRIWRSMIRDGIEPQEPTYCAFIKVCSKGGLVTEAEELFDEMLRNGIRPGVFSYNTLLDAYARSVTPDTAKEIYMKCRALINKMQSSGKEPCVRTYSSFLNVCAKGALIEETRQVLEEACQTDVGTHLLFYNRLIDAYAQARDANLPSPESPVEIIKSIFAEIRSRGLEPTVKEYNSVMKLYGVYGMIDKALEVIDEIKQKGMMPDFVSFYICFKYCLLKDKQECAPAVYEKMKELGINVDNGPEKLHDIMRILLD